MLSWLTKKVTALVKYLGRNFSPTKLAALQDAVINYPLLFDKKYCMGQIWKLERFNFLFWLRIIPKQGNIYIRQQFILAGLYCVVKGTSTHIHGGLINNAAKYWKETTEFEFIEGVEYEGYTESAYYFYLKLSGNSGLFVFNELIRKQLEKFAAIASLNGEIAGYDNRKTTTLRSTTPLGLTHGRNYSTFRGYETFILINHDQDYYKFRKNLHRDPVLTAYFVQKNNEWIEGAAPSFYPGFSNKVFNSSKYNCIQAIFTKEFWWRFLPLFLMPKITMSFNSSSLEITVGKHLRAYAFQSNTFTVADFYKNKLVSSKVFSLE